MKSVSYSQYKMWDSCSMQWLLTYVIGPREYSNSIHTIFGNAMHTVTQEWITDYVYGQTRRNAKRVDLSGRLKEELVIEFQKTTITVDGVVSFVCDKNDLVEFYKDGCQILLYLQDHINDFFNDEWHLEGIELPLSLEVRPGIKFVGYLDIVLRHKLTGMIKIVDLKTSGHGWNKWAKQDKSRTNQLLLYKKFYAQQFGVEEDYVSVEFVILRRKINEDAMWPQHRISKFSPPNKKISLKKATTSFTAFLDACFTDEGEHISDGHTFTPSKSSCRFCAFRNKPEICSESEWKDG